LAAVYLLEVPPKYAEAKAAADIALTVDAKQVKALYRRAQAQLEDGREGLPEASLRAALEDFRAARALEPGNAQIMAEAERVERRVAAIEAARRVPEPVEILKRVPAVFLVRGGDCLLEHGYVWGQTESVVHLFVPAQGVRVTRSADVVCEVKAQSLHIALPSADGRPPFELQGALHKPVRPDDSSWQLEDGGLLLHVEIAKRDGEGFPELEHWRSVWSGHAETKAPSAEEEREVQSMARAACMAEAREGAKEQKQHPKQAETLQRLREMCPGVNVEWGDTSLDSFR